MRPRCPTQYTEPRVSHSSHGDPQRASSKRFAHDLQPPPTAGASPSVKAVDEREAWSGGPRAATAARPILLRLAPSSGESRDNRVNDRQRARASRGEGVDARRPELRHPNHPTSRRGSHWSTSARPSPTCTRPPCPPLREAGLRGDRATNGLPRRKPPIRTVIPGKSGSHPHRRPIQSSVTGCPRRSARALRAGPTVTPHRTPARNETHGLLPTAAAPAAHQLAHSSTGAPHDRTADQPAGERALWCAMPPNCCPARSNRPSARISQGSHHAGPQISPIRQIALA